MRARLLRSARSRLRTWTSPVPTGHATVLPGSRCPTCGSDVDEWVGGEAGSTSALCPVCKCLPRQRHLAVLLERLGDEVSTARNVLEYAPTVVTRRILTSHVPRGYHGIDVARHRDVDLIGDATRLPLTDGSLDLQVSFHVLEHIPDDAAVVGEMYRVAAPGGLALVQCPFRRGRPTDEDPEASPTERQARFGHRDHVRLYGDDFTDRLAAPGFHVELLVAGDYLDSDLLSRAAIPATSPIWVLRRPGRRPT